MGGGEALIRAVGALVRVLRGGWMVKSSMSTGEDSKPFYKNVLFGLRVSQLVEASGARHRKRPCSEQAHCG